MKSFEYKLTDKEGIHARPAGLFVKEAAKFSSNITIKKGDKSADAKRIFAVMGLAAKQNDVVTVECEGDDEAEAITTIEEFFKANF